MATITIRNIPEDTHAELVARAARAGQSLQEYLKGQLMDIAGKPEMKEWLARVREIRETYNANVSVEDILAARDADRT